MSAVIEKFSTDTDTKFAASFTNWVLSLPPTSVSRLSSPPTSASISSPPNSVLTLSSPPTSVLTLSWWPTSLSTLSSPPTSSSVSLITLRVAAAEKEEIRD